MPYVARRATPALLVLTLIAAVTAALTATATAQEPGVAYAVTVEFIEYIQGQPACSGVGYIREPGDPLSRADCGYVKTVVTPFAAVPVTVTFTDATGTVVNTSTATTAAATGRLDAPVAPALSWAPGPLTFTATVDAPNSGTGTAVVDLNPLDVSLSPAELSYDPGDDITVDGTVEELDLITCCVDGKTPVAAAVVVDLTGPDGAVLDTQSATADAEGAFSVTFPGSATAALTPDATTGYRLSLGIRAAATYDDPRPFQGTWAGTGATSAVIRAAVGGLQVDASFVSSTGWVKPGDSYPFRVLVKNFDETVQTGAVVTVTPPRGATFTEAVGPAGPVPIAGDGSITWAAGTIAAGTASGPTVATLVVQSVADTVDQEPTIVWRDLSATAELTADGAVTAATAATHGPKVIPPDERFDTARYGDRPFPVVPVEYFDRERQPANSSGKLDTIINDPGFDGSTFNLFQEMSFGQLFPEGDVPSSSIGSADFAYGPGFDFSTPAPGGACDGTSFAQAAGTPLYPERVREGWYRLPGDTRYYGTDRTSYAGFGAVVAGLAGPDIDSACGPTGKSVFDAAQIADPEIDYNDFDTDKDGVVDFFMMVFVGCGGNGESQLSVAGCAYPDAPYDNIWPHSSSLEFYFRDAATGLTGYISDDQLTDLSGVPQCWKDSTYTVSDACAADGGTGDDAIPVQVRVGPYNVNPETVFESASVISHEYGHSLGLPDFYSIDPDRQTYGTWNLMATDRSQNMDVFGKQELGWIVPEPLEPGTTTNATAWQDSKVDTGRIHWQTPDGTPYTLTATGGDQNIHNGQAYVAKLPSAVVLDPAKFASGTGATPSHTWWSGSGNDYGCPPTGGRNLDIHLPELADLADGTAVGLTFQSLWDIEWDFDYGYVMVSTDGGESYASLPSENGYTTPASTNPNANGCQSTYGNGITGTSGSYDAGTQDVDRLAVVDAYPDSVFLTDAYDLSGFVGQDVVLRFSYATDPGLARPGWFIDDLEVTAGGETIYATDFETSGTRTDPRVFSGGCKEDGRVAAVCTNGWRYVDASEGSPADHAYYLEMRDRSGFDADGRNQAGRGPASFGAGLYLMYTDESHGYGNVGTDNPPGQSPLDSQPQVGNEKPNLDDAAWTLASGDTHFDDDVDDPWIDNYLDPDGIDGNWTFDYGCLSFDVTALSGTAVGPLTVGGADTLTGDVTMTAGDGCRPYDYGYVTAEVVDLPPIAAAQASPTNALSGAAVTFDGSGSSDDVTPKADLGYAWNFGDGSTATGQIATHAYAAAGTYTATLTVTDGSDQTDSDAVVVTVTDAAPVNQAPTAHAGPDERTVPAQSEVSFTGASSSDPDKGDTLTYAWAVSGCTGGGSAAPASGTAVVFTTTFDDTGAAYDCSVTLTVRDAAGATDSDVVLVHVTPNQGPTADAGPDRRVIVGESVAFSGTAADPDGGPVQTRWTFGDGSSASTLDASHTFATSGLYTVTLRVTDDEGAVQADTATVQAVAFDRSFGANRVQTAVALAGLRPSADTVVLATTQEYPDALAGAPLAFAADSPLLLNPSDALAAEVRAEIERLGATKAILLGGPAALSFVVQFELEDMGLTVDRVGGADRFETAALIADRIGGSAVYVVEGRNVDPQRGWPDAVAVAPLAALTGVPILLVETEAIPTATAAALDDLTPSLITIVGGTAAVSAGVEEALAERASTVRTSGADRFATSAALASSADAQGADPNVVWLTTGRNWPDALAVGSVVAAQGGILLLVDPTDLGRSAPTRDWLAANVTALRDVFTVGGPAAVQEVVVDQVKVVVRAP